MLTASQMGEKGGSAGRGTSKIRGDSEYYKNIRAKRKSKATSIYVVQKIFGAKQKGKRRVNLLKENENT